MLLKAKEDLDYILGTTIAKCLDILQSTPTMNLAIIAKKRGTSLKLSSVTLK